MKIIKKFKRLATTACVAAIGLPILGSIASAQVFTDRAAFQAALNTFSIETFEGTPLVGTISNGAIASLSLPAFTVSATPTAVKVLGTSDGFGSHNTTPGGSRFLYLDTDIGLQGTLTTFQFNGPLSAFGFDYTGVTQPGTTFTALLAGQTYSLTLNSSTADSKFWGFIGLTPFSTVTLDSGIDSGYGIDQVTFAVVPEPSSLSLLAVGLFVGFVRTGKRRDT